MAEVHTYDMGDWQLVDGSDTYKGTKIQLDLIPAELSCHAGPSAQVRSPLYGGRELVHVCGARQRVIDLYQKFHALSRAFVERIVSPVSLVIGFN
jgi:hypothetical protein